MISRIPRSRFGSSLITAAAIAASTASTFLPAAPAAATVPVVSPMRFSLQSTDKVTDVLAVGSDVWVSAGNSILIASPTGQIKKTVPGVFGAKGLTLSADAQSVYVSSSTAATIVQVGTDGTIVDSWPSQTCPGKSAVVGGALYYAYGCDVGTAGVARLDLTTHEDKSLLNDISAQALTAAASTLVIYASGGSGYSMKSYAINGDGSLTKNASVQTGGMYDAEISPDGTKLIMTDYDHPYGVARYNAATLALEGTFSTGPYPNAVAWSPDGTKFAGIADASYDVMPVRIFSATDGSTLVTSTAAGNDSYESPAHEASWSPDGKYLFSLTQEYSKGAYLVVTPVAGQAATTLKVGVTPATAYGKQVTIAVSAANRPHAVVTVSVTQAGVTSTKTATTDGAGAVKLSLTATANGSVTVTVPGDLAHLAATATASFGTPSSVTPRLVGAKRVSQGVRHYTSISKVRSDIQLLPKRPGRVTVTLQHFEGGQWRTDHTVKFTAAADGIVSVGLVKGNKKVTYRFTAKAAADTTAGAAPRSLSPSFVID